MIRPDVVATSVGYSFGICSGGVTEGVEKGSATRRGCVLWMEGRKGDWCGRKGFGGGGGRTDG